jgi:predicted phage terminase large subunit-like protein
VNRQAFKDAFDRVHGQRLTLERDFRAYVQAAWGILNPADPLSTNCWYVDAICEHLQAVAQGKITRLIISQPPRSGKSTTTSILYPTWRWATSPSERFAFWSYSEELSVKFSVRRRDVIQSEWYQRLWGSRYELKWDENQKHFFSNDKTGFMEVLRGATGSGAATLILDDVHSMRSLSDVERQNNVDFARTGLLTRLDRPKDSPVIIVGQRVHDADIIGVLLETEGSDWVHLNLAARVEGEPQKVYFPLSGKTLVRQPGDLLDEQRMPVETLDRLRAEMGQAAFHCQYNQNPQPAGGVIIDPSWFQLYAPAELDGVVFDEIILSVDTAVKKSEASCAVAIQAWGTKGNDIYLLDRSTRKRNFVETLEGIRAMAERVGTRNLLIEAKSSGDQVAELLGHEFFITKETPTTDKVSRLQTCSQVIQSGHVHLPNSEVGLGLQRLAAKAPNVSAWDDLDAMSQVLKRHAKYGAGSLDGWKRYAEIMASGRYSDGTRLGALPGEKKPLTAAEKYVRELHDASKKDTPLDREPKPGPEHTGDKPPEKCSCGGNLFCGAGSAKCVCCQKIYIWRR